MPAKKHKTDPRGSSPSAPPFSRALAERVVSLVREFTEPLCADEGLELVHIECQREPGGRVLRLYLDKSGGIGLDDCARISRQVSDYLDVSIEELGSYSLEVSSPGPERPLGKRSDFQRFEGYRVKIATYRPLDGRKNFTGLLGAIEGKTVRLQVNEKSVEIPLSEIRRARLVDGEN